MFETKNKPGKVFAFITVPPQSDVPVPLLNGQTGIFARTVVMLGVGSLSKYILVGTYQVWDAPAASNKANGIPLTTGTLILEDVWLDDLMVVITGIYDNGASYLRVLGVVGKPPV